ncbi:MAG: EutN/CcmL family microcompartment protein [Lachnospiraceae bacterium]|nr:EutN/CcmL family microcompartment protein [Lachnospiraceae bacterium]
MILAYVKGTVVSTNKTSQLKGRKLLVVEEWNPLTGECSRHPKVAVDTVNAGEGELVFCVSGSSARQTEETEKKPVDLAIIGIIDQVDMEGKVLYTKYKKE